jgi:phosphatidylserine/phosphatidylglycerophosphate/cardiolipin synthase-like enzyme
VRVLRSYEGIRAFSPWALTTRNIPWATLPPEGVKEILTALKIAIDKAANYIYVEDQTLNPSGSTRLYQTHKILYPSIAAACARGVKVLFVTQGTAGAPSPVPTHLLISPEIEDLILDPLSTIQRANFALYYIKDVKVHSKLVIVDDEFVSIGSANFWDRSMMGTESELNAMVVHPGQANSLAADLRVYLWRHHLRVSQSPTVDAELRDLSKSLGFFRSTWGTGITFPHPNSGFVEISSQ